MVLARAIPRRGRRLGLDTTATVTPDESWLDGADDLLGELPALIGVPGAAVAAIELTSPQEVATSIPAGTLSLAGTEPRCTVVQQDVEYHCTLARAPSHEVAEWKGTVEPTVDASKHVNGGCRSLRSEGTVWQCYLGRAAVDQQIIGAGFLGEYAPAPASG